MRGVYVLRGKFDAVVRIFSATKGTHNTERERGHAVPEVHRQQDSRHAAACACPDTRRMERVCLE